MKLISKSKTHLAALTLAICALVACNDNGLKAVATNVDRVAIVIDDAREIRDELLAQGLIDRDDAYKTTLALYKINGAFKSFNAKAKTYVDSGALTPEGKADLTKLATDIADTASELVSSGAIGVKNPDAQAKINVAIAAIKQVALALVDTVKALKPKSAAQQANAGAFGLIPVILAILRKIMSTASAEAEREGKTTAEIFEAAGTKLEANELALLNDLVTLAPDGEVPPEIQAKVNEFLANLTA
jgi:hypothetical protein